jgi:hypothetical protein
MNGLQGAEICNCKGGIKYNKYYIIFMFEKYLFRKEKRIRQFAVNAFIHHNSERSWIFFDRIF